MAQQEWNAAILHTTTKVLYSTLQATMMFFKLLSDTHTQNEIVHDMYDQ